MISRMDSSISIVGVIHSKSNNFHRYFKRIHLSRWWIIYYLSSGSSSNRGASKQGVKQSFIHDREQQQIKTALTVEVSFTKFTFQQRFAPRQRRQKIVLMTHKYRGCIAVLSINKSVEPNEEQKVLQSDFDQGFTVNTSKQFIRGF